MRTPIFPSDLLADKGFKLIAKKLMKRWPGSKPIGLSAAREMLARGLGYNVSVRPSHLPNSSIKGDGVRVFLSGRDRPYRQDLNAPTKLLS
ncbi:hypothetical protein [Pseudomonas viridiflava]|uniref:hypothetical protein n=1 Tax=Pseudomonas viridiflava TaxID=33069 RepID=UPI001302F70F|nr:hypothetical protein [Pseudomonas viridiflava]